MQKRFLQIWSEGVDWIHPVRDMQHWRFLVAMVMALGAQKMRRISGLAQPLFREVS